MNRYFCPACEIEFPTGSAYGNHCRNAPCKGGTPEQRFWADVVKGDGCWLYNKGIKPEGYRFFRYRLVKGKQVQWYAHRYSWTVSFGPIHDGLDVAHKCDNRGCVRPDHLFLATHDENMADCKAKGRKAYGEATKRNKLTEADVLEIRATFTRKSPKNSNANELAAKYGVYPMTIIYAAEGKTWAHLNNRSGK